MAITYVGIGTRVDTSSGTPTLAYPAGIVAGDVLLAPAYHKATATAISAPSNALTWTDTGSGVIYQKVFMAVYDGSAAAPTLDSASVQTYGRMIALRSSNTIFVDAIAQSGATQVNLHYPSLTINNDNEFVLTFCFTNSAITSVAVDSGFTELEDWSTTASAGGVQIQYQIQGTATNIPTGNPVVTGGTSAATHGITLALTESKPLTDTTSIQAVEGTFDTVNLNLAELASLTDTEALSQSSQVSETDSASLHIVEGIGATVSTGSISESLSDTASLTLTETIMEAGVQATLTDTASLTVTDVVTSNQTSPQSLADTASISTVDQASATFGNLTTLNVAFNDAINLRLLDVLSAQISGPVLIEHILFIPSLDHITFSVT